MIRLLALAAIATVLMWPARAILVRVRATERAPCAAIALWQALASAVCIALVGVCIEVISLAEPRVTPRRPTSDFTIGSVVTPASHGPSPHSLFVLTATLVCATVLLGAALVRTVSVSRGRARRRSLIDLVGTETPALGGAVVVSYPTATAFSLPGWHGRVVISSAAVDALDADELAAVLAHERAHLRAHHDLVLLPFRALCTTLPRSRALAAVREHVSTLVEMAADDRAIRECDRRALGRALCRLADEVATASPGASTGSGDETARRMRRALAPTEGAPLFALGSILAAAVMLALPVIVLASPLGSR